MNSHRVKQERRREKKGRRPHTNGLISRHHLLLSYVVRVFLLLFRLLVVPSLAPLRTSPGAPPFFRISSESVRKKQPTFSPTCAPAPEKGKYLLWIASLSCPDEPASSSSSVLLPLPWSSDFWGGSAYTKTGTIKVLYAHLKRSLVSDPLQAIE